MNDLMGWHTVEMYDSVHVFPDYESGHVIGAECWCQPRIDNTFEISLVHHRDEIERCVGKRPNLQSPTADN